MHEIKKEHIILNIEDILHYENNNKIHTEKDINEVIKSIKKDWYIAPICVDEENVLLAGHGRTLALIQMWYTKIDAIKVYWMSEKQKADYRIRDNTTALLAEFNLDHLKIELEKLWDFSKDLVDHLDFDLWLNFWNESENVYREEIEDEVPEAWEKILVETWDIFKLWTHYLMCWSSTDEKDIKTLLGWKEIQMVLTDPPYLMSYEGSIWADGKKHGKKHKKIENDDLKWDDGIKFLEDFSKIIKKYCKWSFYIFFYRLWIDKIFKALENVNLRYRNLIIWKKNHFNLSPTDYKSIYEPIVNGWADDYTPIFYWWNAEHKFYWKKGETDVIDDIQVSSVLESQKTLKNDLHPTMKPIALLEKILNNSSKEWDNVLDLFGWSWSTLIACEKKARVCFMMELSPEYIQVIIKRFYDVTWWTVPIECLNRDCNFSFLSE